MRTKWTGLLIVLTLFSCGDNRDQLLQELADPSPIKRSGALRVLAKQGDAEAYRLLNHGLQDSSVVVRIAAVQGLAAFEGRDTTPALIRAARDADPEVREAVVTALAARGGDRVVKTLVDLLEGGEPSPKVRRKIHESLGKLGLVGQALADRISAAQIELVKKRWDDASPPQRARLVRMAGRSIHPQGIELVARALGDPEAEVVLAALDVLDGRGGKPVLRQLLVLASDQAQKIRLAAIDELGRHGPQGLAIIRGALRDLDPEVRLRALRQVASNRQKLGKQAVCPLLADGDPEVARAAAQLIGERKLACDLAGLEKGLAQPDSDEYRKTVGVLSLLGGEAAIKILASQLKKLALDRKAWLASALARAGDRSKPTGRLLEKGLQDALDALLGQAESWVDGRLPPKMPDPQVKPAEPVEDTSKLSEEQLKKLYQKHGLPPAGEDSPRGVADILKGFPEPAERAGKRRLFLPDLAPEIERLAELLDGLALFSPDSAGSYLHRALDSDLPELGAWVARIATGRGLKLELSDQQLRNLAGQVKSQKLEEASAIIDLLGRPGDERTTGLLLKLLQEVSAFEKREHLISVLGKLKEKQCVGVLTDLLSGYSAASAAWALGEIGDPRALDGLKQALVNAGPSAKMSILMALAKLGSQEIVPVLAEKLSDPNPEVRRTSVAILGLLGGQKALQLLQQARYDPDRLVSKEAREHLADKQRRGGG